METNKKVLGSKSIPFRLIEQKQEVNSLVIVLPGAGYTTQAPLLHFTTGLFYTKGFDVLHINYSYNRQELSDISIEDFKRDVQLAIDNAIKSKNYSNYYIVAKSIGTKALSDLLNNTRLQEAKVVWLTPILQNDEVFKTMANCNNKGLCIIGDKDPCFIEQRFERLTNNHNLTLKVLEGGNHGLELEKEPIKSIDLLKDVISDMNEFLKLNGHP
ncbi:alpha/beta hydrolase [Fredinandcohnia sp. QZ13]|uniref:alpha/beta family hydrolase n=1 Tax=Fredinandcohnia sp. QZ13 TaxID=3073144 RepID=UPI0028535A22|nr:alpha/beta family hydrolase [Fredinandcohnia sp. QZ13]MDR4886039.1 alpha/beta hydrolase [Fredinandcohnia sp. QZ13]